MIGISKRRIAGISGLPALVTMFLCGTTSAASWQVRAIDTAAVGQFSSLKIDAEGNAHVAYVLDTDDHLLRYGFWDHVADRWFTMTVAKGAQFSCLVLDSKQHPHISYVDFGTGVGARVHYAHWDGTAWKTEGIGPPGLGSIGYFTSIVLDKNDYPVISYYDYAGPGGVFILRLRTYAWNGKYWEARTVDPEYGSGKFNSLAIDSAGNPHIAYANVGAMHASLRYASWNGRSWDTEVLEGVTAAFPVYSVAMVLDKNDSPHITYTDITTHQVKYAYRAGGKWQFELVQTLTNNAYPDRNGIALDEEGNPYLSYYDSGSGVLLLAHREGKNWVAETVDQNFAGFTSSIQIDHQKIFVTYADEAGALKVARKALPQVQSAVREGPAPAERTRP
jgi:hypothetical protein